MKRLLAVGVVLLLTLGSGVGVSLGESPHDAGGNLQSLRTAQEFDRVQFRITAYENGSARWTFQYQRTLSNATERQQFQNFASTFNENDTTLYRDFQTQAQSLAAAGSKATDREMTATSFRKHASVGGLDQNLGVVSMSFVWTNFGVEQGDQIVFGDVFEGGLYIGSSQSLVIETSDGLAFVDALPEPTSISSGTSLEASESVTWEGEQEFADQRPRVVFGPASNDTNATATTSSGGSAPSTTGTNTNATTGTTAGPGRSGGGLWMMIGAVLVLIVGLTAAFFWFDVDEFDSFPGGVLSSDGGGDDGDGGVSAAQPPPSPPSVPEEELLTDEARVRNLLEDNGGRMKQVNIVEETGWSKSKVSMLLSEMAEDGVISKLRMGRENIISLDGHEPDAARSPYEED